MQDIIFRRVHFAVLFLVICLTACQTQPKLPPAASSVAAIWQQHQTALTAVKNWHVRGKLGFRSPHNNGSGQLRWSQFDELFDINLKGPFGQGAMQITGSPDQVRLEIAGQGEFTSDSPSELLVEQLGWSAPVRSLAHWAKGNTAPGAYDALQLNEQGQLESLTQHGWQIQFARYRGHGDLILPHKIKLERNPVKLTLVISEWQLDPDDTSK